MYSKVSKLLYPELSYKIVGILFEVYNELGYGYHEAYYQKAIEQELKMSGVNFIPQAPYKLVYKGKMIGRNYIDFVIEKKVILEIKQGTRFTKEHYNQIIKYLKATKLKLGILASFSNKGLFFKRVLNIY